MTYEQYLVIAELLKEKQYATAVKLVLVHQDYDPALYLLSTTVDPMHFMAIWVNGVRNGSNMVIGLATKETE